MKKKTIGVLVLAFLCLQILGETSLTLGYTASITEGSSRDVEFEQQARASEEMKVVIGVPNTIDVGDSIPVVVAGMRDAKSKYIKPLRIRIELLSYDPTASEIDNEDQVLVATKESWYYEDQWIGNNESTSIERLNDYLYLTEFAPLDQEVTVEIKAYIDWVAPWNEIFTSTGSEIVELGNWRDYTQYLETSADDVRSEVINGFQDDAADTTGLLNDVQEEMKALQDVMEYKKGLSDLGVEDPSEFHFYLLNITTIINGTDPNSYVGQLDDSAIYLDGKTKKQYYIDLLSEINEAFVASLSILDKKNIPYTITYVNYTYTNTNYDLSIDKNGQVAGAEDADWDDENFNDTSLEFLLEGTSWSGHPDHLHQDMFIQIDTPSAATYTMESLVDSYSATLVNPAYQDTDWVSDSGNSRLDYLNMYQGFVKMYSNDSNTIWELEEGVDFSVDGSTQIQILNNSIDGSECLIIVERPGGWRKENKGIIVNLMADLFPIMNRFYFTPRGLADPVPETYLNEYYIDPTNSSYIAPPLKRCIMQFDDITGDVNDDYIEADINENILPEETQYANLTDYTFYLSSLGSGVPYFVNVVGKPFGTLVYDDNVDDGDSYDSSYNESDFNDYIEESVGDLVRDTYGVTELATVPIFSLMDYGIGMTADEGGGGIQPHQTNSYDWFYKNSWGNWIDAFFNGTRLDGNDPAHYDMVQPYPNSWTFRYIDRDVSQIDESSLPAEYQLSPFQGPSDYTPIGIMTLGRVMLSQNSMKNLTAGFGYVYGLIYNIYRRAYDAQKSILIQLQQRMVVQENEEAVQVLQYEIELIDQAWEDLNLTLIDEIGKRVDDYLNNPNNQYTSNNGRSLFNNVVDRVRDKVDLAIERLESNQNNAVSIDNELSNTEYDVRKLGILEEVVSFLKKIQDWLLSLEDSTSNVLKSWSSGFNDTVDDATTWVHTQIVSINKTLDTWNGYILTNITGWGEAIEGAASELGGKLDRFSYAMKVVVGTIGSGLAAAAIGIAAGFNPAKLAAGIAIGGVAAGLIAYFVGKDSASGIGDVVEAMGITISEKLGSAAQTIYDGLDTVRTNLVGGLEKAYNGIKLAGDQLKASVAKVTDTISRVVGKMSEVGVLIIDQTILIVKAINETLNLVNDVIGEVFNKISDVYQEVKRQLQKVGQFVIEIMGESLGRVKDLMAEAAGSVFEKLKFVGESILNHSAFVKVRHLYDKVVSATSSAGFTLYSTEYAEVDEDVVLRWADTMQPLAEINSADRGLYVFQMGDEFAEELYYVVVYQDQLIDPDSIDFRIRRWGDLSEYGGEGYSLLEAYPVIQKFEDEEGDARAGIYFLNFTEGTEIQWYKENSTEPYVNASAPAGNYLTMFNVTYEDRPEWDGEDIDGFCVEKTALFTKEYITDAFPVISLAGYNPDEPEPYIVEAGGDELILDVNIDNKMWSTPYVQVDLILTTVNEDNPFDGGTTLAQLRYSNVPLEAEGSTEIAAGWSVGKYTPSGQHQLLISVTEVNGDTTIISVPMTVDQSNVFVNFFASLFTTGWGYGVIGLVMAIIITGVTLYFRKKSQLTASITSSDTKSSQKVSKQVKSVSVKKIK